MAPARACATPATMSASARGADRRRSARGDGGAGDMARVALFAEGRDNGRKLALGRQCHDVGRGRTGAAHAHIERTIVTKGKAACGLIELHRGDTKVED